MNVKIASNIIHNSSFQSIKTLIKIVSTILISGAILWEVGNLYAAFNHWQISNNLNWIFWIDRIALISHGIEAIIAAYYTRLQQKNPLQYSIYTFFVGTVGLLELKIGQEETE